MARFTKKTREIMNFIDKYGFITISMCANIFYTKNSNGYTQAQVKLRTLYNDGELQRYVHPNTKEYIYQIKSKVIDDHRKYIMDFYSKVYSLSDEIIYFKLEETIGKRRCDAHIIYSYKGNNIGALIEFDKFHKTGQSKLDEIYKSEIIQEWYYEKFGIEYFPTFIIISALGKTDIKSDDYSVIGLDYQFSNLEKIL